MKRAITAALLTMAMAAGAQAADKITHETVALLHKTFITPLDRERRMPLLLAFILIGLLIWIAENIATFFSIWRYPDQIGVWSTVQIRQGGCI